MMNENINEVSKGPNWKSLYITAGVSAFVAMVANILDVAFSFGEMEVFAYGTKTAADWFTLFQSDGFKGLYVLGILNIIYQICLIPLYLALYTAHRHTDKIFAALALIIFLSGVVIYLSRNAAIPMYVLSGKHAAATTDAQRAIFAAAGEAALAGGEDFTPGAFIGLIFGGIAAVSISIVMLRGGVFNKITAWIGIIGFSLLSIFIILATFVPSLYMIAYYGFGTLGGLFALAWFFLVARRFFQLAKN